MNFENLSAVDEKKLKAAFKLVQNKTDWKAPIDAYVKVEDLDELGLTLTDIRDAVVFYTATELTLARQGAGYYVRAAGYRAGPAGP